jgi:hypothetical protein
VQPVPRERRTDHQVYTNHINYWNDEPTGDAVEDCGRGKRFVAELIRAIRDDAIEPRDLELIVESMVRDGVRREKRGAPSQGRGSAERQARVCHTIPNNRSMIHVPSAQPSAMKNPHTNQTSNALAEIT